MRSSLRKERFDLKRKIREYLRLSTSNVEKSRSLPGTVTKKHFLNKIYTCQLLAFLAAHSSQDAFLKTIKTYNARLRKFFLSISLIFINGLRFVGSTAH